MSEHTIRLTVNPAAPLGESSSSGPPPLIPLPQALTVPPTSVSSTHPISTAIPTSSQTTATSLDNNPSFQEVMDAVRQAFGIQPQTSAVPGVPAPTVAHPALSSQPPPLALQRSPLLSTVTPATLPPTSTLPGKLSSTY